VAADQKVAAGQIRTVVFDMDGVLCAYDFQARLAHMARSTGVAAETIDTAIFRSGFDDMADQGRFDADGYLREFSARIGATISRGEWLAARAASMRPDRDMLTLARRLGQRQQTAMLTNNGPVLREGLTEVFPEALELFGSRAFFSCTFGCGKEDTAVFAALLARLEAAPGETLFIDDSADYVANARQTGLVAHHFTGIAGLQAHLRQLALAS